jgi:general secretion pathway protein H
VRERGFSFIELMVVLILFSLSIALMAPSFGRFSKSIELKSAAKKVAAILRYYRSESANQGKVYQVSFNVNTREVKVQRIEPDESKEEGEKQETPGMARTFLLPEGVQLKEVTVEAPQFPSDLPAIEFYPNGGSNGGDILLNTAEHKGFKIRVRFLTGSVVIEQAEKK